MLKIIHFHHDNLILNLFKEFQESVPHTRSSTNSMHNFSQKFIDRIISVIMDFFQIKDEYFNLKPTVVGVVFSTQIYLYISFLISLTKLRRSIHSMLIVR